jgi:hypothetical protein
VRRRKTAILSRFRDGLMSIPARIPNVRKRGSSKRRALRLEREAGQRSVRAVELRD